MTDFSVAIDRKLVKKEAEKLLKYKGTHIVTVHM
jgi:hypothetical protein